MSESFVRTVQCESAAEFFNQLTPTSPHFANAPARGWFFRGHENSEFRLVPSAFRRMNEGLHRFGWSDEAKDMNVQVAREIDVIEKFFAAADSQGSPIPEDS